MYLNAVLKTGFNLQVYDLSITENTVLYSEAALSKPRRACLLLFKELYGHCQWLAADLANLCLA